MVPLLGNEADGLSVWKWQNMTGFRMVYVSAALLASTRMGDLVLFVFISIDVKLFEVFTILLLNRKKKKKKKCVDKRHINISDQN